MNRELSSPLKALKNQLTHSLVNKLARTVYSRSKVGDGSQKGSIWICLNKSGTIEAIGYVYISTGIGAGRVLNVIEFWVSWDVESRMNDSTGTDGRRQGKEDYGSGEELGEHLEK
jgi:hypothetical protein